MENYKHRDKHEAERILWQIAGRDNWQAVEEIEKIGCCHPLRFIGDVGLLILLLAPLEAPAGPAALPATT